MHRALFAISLCLLLAAPALAEQLVAPTGPNTPGEQRKMFHLPPGFEIQLVASEPEVHKSMNLKFDNRGRIWVTHSLEYPFAAKDGAKARDRITVFSELDDSGRARRVENFAEQLNIPIGVLPLGEKEAIAWSIPNIYKFSDTTGDGKADKKTVLLGTYGIIDTHGNQNGFTRWLDGWVYACHGFNNTSEVKLRGEGDVVLKMNSGNTYRFLPDGSAIEQVSFGQVNPFGLAFDPLGNMFTADCHSRPVTMVLREGHYQSFGKPHDGLGFAPETTDKDHGGTGIAGMVYYAAEHFPPEFRDVLFVGNVITNRIHCDRLAWHGSSPVVEKVEDFLTCDDPWFRPVDIQLGPDGALYVLDFYNKIIGHYEVPLTHPERDRERGRVWRIVYKGHGESKPGENPLMPDLNKASADEMVKLLDHPNLMVRTLATNALVDRERRDPDALKITLPTDLPTSWLQPHGLWIALRLGLLDKDTIAAASEKCKDRLSRVHLAHVMGEMTEWNPGTFEIARTLLNDGDPHVRRAAVQALARHPAAENIPALLKVQRETPAEDVQLAHATKIALRNQLRSDAIAEGLAKLELSKEERKQLLEIAALSATGPAALLIYDAALQGEVSNDLLTRALPAVAKHIDAARIDAFIDFVSQKYKEDSTTQLSLLRSLHEGIASRGIAPSDKLRESLTTLLRAAVAGKADDVWANYPVEGAAPSASPWAPQAREYKDGQNTISMISSLPAAGGPAERMTGVLRSPKFKLPKELSYWMCGHNGLPSTKDTQKNYIRLVLEDGTEVARSYPPRMDIAQPFKWDLSAHEGKTGRVEVVDNFVADGYAWLAVSRFEPAVIRIPTSAVGDVQQARADLVRLASQLRLTALAPEVTAIAKSDSAPVLKLAACDALVTLQPNEAITPLANLIADAQLAAAQRQQAAEILGRIDSDDARAALVAQLRGAPQPVAIALAGAMAGSKSAAPKLLEEIRAGKASAALLREPTVLAKLKTADIAELDQQISELTAKLAPADNRIATLIKQRREKYQAGKFDIDAGRAVFAKSACAQCHKIGETGATIAPALDGIGVRGLDRLLEDMLDPNRNVDQAFRVTTIVTSGGQTYSGFGLREEGKTLIMHDAQGKEVRVPLDEIEERTPSPLSPMPANLGDQVSEEDFYPLLSFLLSQRKKE